ncbi:MAG: hypothetical protein Q7T56_18135 [Nocardioidaceae bacterium]|nr:hypothetical protein [Nocardioidaceae bacterium]
MTTTDAGRRTSWRATAWHVVRLEVGMYVSLARWAARRPSLGAPGSQVHGYARLVTPMLWLFVFASAVEVVVLDLLLPWMVVRVVALVLGIWGVVWMLGMIASYRVFPHLLEPDRLRVRCGALVDVVLPWSAIASVGSGDTSLESSMRTMQVDDLDDGTRLSVGVGGRVNVQLTLREPVTVSTPRGSLVVTRVSLWADDPRDLVRDVRARLR